MNERSDRADKVLVARGHFDSRSAAQAAIAAGTVRVSGRQLTKPSEKIAYTARIEATAAHPYVSRAGLKLAHAIKVFGVDPTGLNCLDIGASTGGFTQVLLQAGAASIVAVDVGRGQIHKQIAADPRVRSLEAMDARNLKKTDLVAPPELIVCDASFISLSKLLGPVLELAAPGASLIALFKPQFEVGREHIGKGGIVSDETAVQRAEAGFTDWLTGQGWQVRASEDSPIKGGDGNSERLVLAIRKQPGSV
ncbi:MAG: TlyA family rRNA (cytidine-2'-O)-methyltransferase [Henriciella sp.]